MYYSSYTPVPVLAANLLGNFSVAVTYDLFITLGLITAVPVSAGKEYFQLYKVCQVNGTGNRMYKIQAVFMQ
jgi:hypothetical protein